MTSKTKRIIVDILLVIGLIGVFLGTPIKSTILVNSSLFLIAIAILSAITIRVKPELKFVKLKQNAKLPQKNKEDLGYDVYANFEAPFISIKPHETKLVSTGLASIMTENIGVIFKERGSTGSKGIGVRAGVIDSGYKGEWFVGLTNHNNIPLYICKENYINDLNSTVKENKIIYPYEKGICQAIIIPNYYIKTKETSKEKLNKIKTIRGEGKLGSSGK